MRSLLIAASTFALLTAHGAALAQSAPAQPAEVPPAKPSVKTTAIADLLADPAVKAVVDKDLPGLTDDPRLQQAMSMTLTDIEPYSDGKIDDSVLAKVQADFDAIPAH